jgi:hypothetical protein
MKTGNRGLAKAKAKGSKQHFVRKLYCKSWKTDASFFGFYQKATKGQPESSVVKGITGWFGPMVIRKENQKPVW